MRDLLLVFIGGGLGSVVRFLMGRWVDSNQQTGFPFGTFLVNIVACLILGIVIGIADHKQMLSGSRIFWAIGFCGGFSTFSTFSAETLRLFQSGAYTTALLYVTGSLILCLAATLGGIAIGSNAN